MKMINHDLEVSRMLEDAKEGAVEKFRDGYNYDYVHGMLDERLKFIKEYAKTHSVPLYVDGDTLTDEAYDRYNDEIEEYSSSYYYEESTCYDEDDDYDYDTSW